MVREADQTLMMGAPVDRSDYESKFYSRYSEARQLLPEVEEAWMKAATKFIQGTALRGIDLGSGTGRFTGILAQALSAEVTGVEPSEQMRDVAVNAAPRPNVRFVAGSAEKIPLEEGAYDFAWLSMMIHHVPDKAACVRELWRVLKPGGKVLVRNTFLDQVDRVPLYRYFPAALEFDRTRLPTFAAIKEVFTENGFEFVAQEGVWQVLSNSLTDYAARLRKGAISSFEQLPASVIEAGLKRMIEEEEREQAAIPVNEEIGLLVFHKEGNLSKGALP